MVIAIARLGTPDHVIVYVDVGGPAFASAQRSEVEDGVVLPENGPPFAVGRQRPTDDRARGIDRRRNALVSPERAEVGDDAVVPHAGVRNVTGRVGIADDASVVVGVEGFAVLSSQRP